MSSLRVQPSVLEGNVTLSGAKNAALRHLAASILTDSEIHLSNYPSTLLDAQVHVSMLEKLGKICHLKDQKNIYISDSGSLLSDLDWSGRSIRNTLLILGALVARTGSGSVPIPGGCQLGDRKYDLHIDLLKRLGADVWVEDSKLCASSDKGLVGADIHLKVRSTGATENSIICASLAKGTTRIWNPHIRPEIIDLISLLNKMNAKITVHGQEHIEVVGVECLSGASHHIIPDSMEAITWLIGAGITKGDVEIYDFPVSDLESSLAHLKSAGCKIYYGDDSVIVRGESCYPIEISTGPHPGINSDVQPLLAAWAANAQGESRIIDLRFPGRYGYAEELAKMGLKYSVSEGMLSIYGNGGNLKGTEVRALDLRAGAAELLCALTASDTTIIHDAWQIFRGYDDLVNKLKSLSVTCDAY